MTDNISSPATPSATPSEADVVDLLSRHQSTPRETDGRFAARKKSPERNELAGDEGPAHEDDEPLEDDQAQEDDEAPDENDTLSDDAEIRLDGLPPLSGANIRELVDTYQNDRARDVQIAAERAAYSERLTEAHATFQQQAQLLDQIVEFAAQLLPSDDVIADTIAYDKAQGVALRDAKTRQINQLRAILELRGALGQEASRAEQDALSAQRRAGEEQILRAAPEWRDPARYRADREAMALVAQHYGLDENLIDTSQPVAMLMLRDYTKLLGQVAAARGKVAAAAATPKISVSRNSSPKRSGRGGTSQIDVNKIAPGDSNAIIEFFASQRK